MKINNTYCRQPFLYPLKILRFLTWSTLAALAFPTILAAPTAKYFLFSLKKTVTVWNENEALDIQVSLRPNLDENTLKTVLDRWIEETSQEENVMEAKSRILDFFNHGEKNCLDLSNLKLHSLPDIFKDPCFNRLKYLSLSHNRFVTLPDTICHLQALKWLHIDHNQLTTLPAKICHIKALEWLKLENNQLIILPDTIGELKKLERLNLEDNQLVNLPRSMGNLPVLTILNLKNNQLIALPDTIGGLQMLEWLNLENNNLANLPDTTNSLQMLKELDLKHNKLITLPHTLSNMQKLKKLNLSHNKLIKLPDTICNLKIKELDLSYNQLTELPQIISSMQKLKKLNLSYNLNLSGSYREIANLIFKNCWVNLEEVPSLLLNKTQIGLYLIGLCDIINKTPTQLPNLIDSASPEKILTLCSWLSRLSDIADYQNETLQKAFINKIINYLEAANTNQKFREAFDNVIQDASETCGDRMALSVLHLGINHELIKMALSDTKTLADFLIRGVWIIDILEKIALQKIGFLKIARETDPNLPEDVEEIEVYLGYLIKLKEKFNIPIDIHDMLFFSCSELKNEDLQEAEKQVLSELKNQTNLFIFLINNDRWKEALKYNYPREFESIEKNKYTALEKDEDVLLIEQKSHQELIELTRKALPNFAIDLSE